MAKDINIHIKTRGGPEAKQQLDKASKSAKGIGTSMEQASNKAETAKTSMLSNLKTIAGVAGFAGLASAATAMARKIINAFDDMKKAANEAVAEMAGLQRQSADYFEAMGAWTPEQRKAELKRISAFQAKAGVSRTAAMSILETQKRQFGAIDEAAAEQFAGYWQLHAQESTTDLMRWLAASGITDTARQGQVMRMISATATQTGLKDPELIQGIVRYSQEYRQLGWTPEQTITNIGKGLSGLSQREARKALSGIVEGIKTFSEEKALEMGAPEVAAASAEQRFEWASAKLKAASPQGRARLATEMFGKTYGAYVTKLVTGEMSPQAQRAIDYAKTGRAAREEREAVLAYRHTPEGILGQAAGIGGQFAAEVSEEQAYEAAARDVGKSYLEFLRRTPTGRIKYEKIKALGLGAEHEKELAAKALYEQQEGKLHPMMRQGEFGPGGFYHIKVGMGSDWETMSDEERFKALQNVNHPAIQSAPPQTIIQTQINNYSRVGVDTGPRVDRDIH